MFRPTTTCDIWQTPPTDFDPSSIDPDLVAVPLQVQKSLASISDEQATTYGTVAYLIFRFAISTVTSILRLARSITGTARPIIGIPDRDGELFEVRDVNRVWDTDTIIIQYLYCVPWIPPGPAPGTEPDVWDRENAPLLTVGAGVGPAIPCISGDASLSCFFSPDHTALVITSPYGNVGNIDSSTGSDRSISVWQAPGPVVNGDATIFSGSTAGITEMLVNIHGQDPAGPVWVGGSDQFGMSIVISDSFTPTKDYLAIVAVVGDGTGSLDVPTDWVQVAFYEDLANNRTYSMYYTQFSGGTAFPGVTLTSDTSLNWTYAIFYWPVP